MNAALKVVFSPIMLVCILLLVAMSAMFFGAYSMSFNKVVAAVFQNDEMATNFLILHIRLPRILLAGVVGAGLAVSGAAIQGLFRNPLAEPSLIGVNSGAMLFAVLSIVMAGSILTVLPAFVQHISLAMFAFLGGLITTYVVYFLARRQRNVHVLTMLLAGIAISAFAGAITGVFIYMSDDQQLRDITFWSMGSFAGATWVQLFIAAPVILLTTWMLSRNAKALNAILLGEKEAIYLGVSVASVKSQIILLTALIVGVCIAMSGIIGFVGLIIPHFLRLVKGSNYNYLLKGSALTGATFLILADTLARTIIAPAELPIGILTAMIGAPFFLWLLVRNKQQTLPV